MDRVDSIDGSGQFDRWIGSIRVDRCIGVRPSVRPSVRLSVRPSVIDRSIGTIDRSIYRYD